MKDKNNQPHQEFLCKSLNGVVVTYDPRNPHLSTHFADTPGLKNLAIEAISKISLDGNLFAGDVDMGRTAGTCDVVEVLKTDEVIYGVRKNRFDDGLVPFVKNREGDSSPFVSIYLTPKLDKTYELGSAWIGKFDDEPFPLSPLANDNSKEYWNKNAFIYGSQEIEPGTESNICPW